MHFILYLPIFLLKLTILFALFLYDIDALVANSYDLGNVLNDKLIIKYSIHYHSFPFPLFSFTKSNTMTKRSLDILNHKLHFVMVVDIIRKEKAFYEFRVQKLDGCLPKCIIKMNIIIVVHMFVCVLRVIMLFWVDLHRFEYWTAKKLKFRLFYLVA